MTVAALIFASLAALLHVFFWWMESITWTKPATWKTFGVASQEDADTTASLAYNQGFYNLFLAIGVAVGVVLHVCCDTRDDVAWTLIIFGCSCMLGAAIVLVTTGKAYVRGAVIQGLFPLLSIASSVVAISS